MDLRGAHDEALALLDEFGKTLPPSARLLREIVARHLELEATRAKRLAEAPIARGSSVPVEVCDGSSTTVAEFTERFIQPGLPCVIRGGTGIPRWTPDELCARLGNRPVPLRRRVDSSVEWARLEFAGTSQFADFAKEHA